METAVLVQQLANNLAIRHRSFLAPTDLDIVEVRARLRGRRVRRAPVLLPAAAHAVQPDALAQHARAQALAETARLARLATPLVDLALIGRGTRVFYVALVDTNSFIRLFITK